MFTPGHYQLTINLSPVKKEDLPEGAKPFKEGQKKTLDKFEMKIRNHTHN
jgi:hypothetical protein